MSYSQQPYGGYGVPPPTQPYPQDGDRGLLGTLAVGGAMAMTANHFMGSNNNQQQQQQPQQPPPPQQQQYQNQQQQQQQGGGGSGYGYAAAGAGAAAAYGAYSYSQGPSYHDTSAVANASLIFDILVRTVRDQNIQPFFPSPDSLHPLAQSIAASGAIGRIAQEWRLPLEVAMDFCKLALFDTWLYLDDSGSMNEGTRKEEVKSVLKRVVSAATQFDTDGISVRFMNSSHEGNGINTEQAAVALLAKVKYTGTTPLGSHLDEKILHEIRQRARRDQLRKPCLIICITDGEPYPEERGKLSSVIRHSRDALSKTRYGPDAVSIQLAQVGNDKAARKFLEEIDSNAEIGRYVDVTSNFENEADNMRQAQPPIALTQELWTSKLLLGPISSALDTTDEKGQGSPYAQKLQWAMQNPGTYRGPAQPGPPPPTAGQYQGTPGGYQPQVQQQGYGGGGAAAAYYGTAAPQSYGGGGYGGGAPPPQQRQYDGNYGGSPPPPPAQTGYYSAQAPPPSGFYGGPPDTQGQFQPQQSYGAPGGPQGYSAPGGHQGYGAPPGGQQGASGFPGGAGWSGY